MAQDINKVDISEEMSDDDYFLASIGGKLRRFKKKVSGPVDMGGYKLTALPDAEDDGDALPYGQSQKLYADSIRTASGSVITADNCAYTPLKGLKLHGKTTQFTTTGKNLLENTIGSGTRNGITYTVNDDGSIACSGTTTSDNSFMNINYGGDSVISIPPGDYIVSGGKDNARIQVLVNGSVVVSSSNGAEAAFTVPDTATSSWARVSVIIMGTTVNTTVFPMIRLASITDNTYEPYTGGIASPNPDYPQELESNGDGGSVDVMVAGRNHFAGLEYPWVISSSASCEFHDNNNFTITAKTAEHNNQIYYFLDAALYCDKTITLSWEKWIYSNTAVIGRVFLQAYDTNDVMVAARYVKSDSGATSAQLNIPKETKKILILFRMSQSDDGGAIPSVGDTVQFGNVQLEVGEKTAYEPYKPIQTLTAQTPNGLPGIPTTDASIANHTDADGQMWVADEIDYGRGVYVQRIGVEVFDGSEGWAESPTRPMVYRLLGWTAANNAVMTKAFCNALGHGAAENNFEISANFNAYTPRPTLDEWKAYLAEQYANGTPVKVQYVLATPIETPLSAEELAAYAELHTNCPNTTVFNDAGADMELTYYTPKTAVQMVHSPSDAGKILGLDEHGCVVLLDGSTKFAPRGYVDESAVRLCIPYINGKTITFSVGSTNKGNRLPLTIIVSTQSNAKGIIQLNVRGSDGSPINMATLYGNFGISSIIYSTADSVTTYTITIDTNGYSICQVFAVNPVTALVEAITEGTSVGVEYENPPMVVGVEYRTTELFNGKPVYVQLLYMGTLPNNSSKSIKAVTSGTLHLVELSGVRYNETASVDGDLFDTTGVSHWVSIVANGLAVGIECSFDGSNDIAYITIKYTKE